jgi:heme/copper-type cytochrome/quinol oxidase subunit 3
MSSPGYGRMRVVAAQRREPLVPSGVMGMLIFVFTEVMLFAGLISAFTIIRSSAVVWPPPGQPRLPFEATAFNTAVLLLSGVALQWARRRFDRSRASARTPLAAAIALGAFFVVVQGAEWVAMIGQGLTITSSTLGSFFYLIVGVHGLHALAALVLLGVTFARLQRGWLASSQLGTAEVLWYFVVAVWPVLWLVVYR